MSVSWFHAEPSIQSLIYFRREATAASWNIKHIFPTQFFVGGGAHSRPSFSEMDGPNYANL